MLRHTVSDASGNVIQNALCNVYLTGTTTPVSDMFTAATGGSPITTLTSNSQGEIIGWVTTPKVVDIEITDNGDTAFYPSTPSSLLTWTTFTETVSIPPDAGVVSDAAYDATTWDGVTSIAPSKNALRDKLETVVLLGARSWYDPVSYGAVADPGDNSTDSTTAILAAIADLKTATHGILRLGAGIWRMRPDLLVVDFGGLTIEGEAEDATVLMLNLGAGAAGVTVAPTSGTLNGFHVRNLSVRGANNTTPTSAAFKLTNVAQISFDHVVFSDCIRGIQQTGSVSHFKATDCQWAWNLATTTPACIELQGANDATITGGTVEGLTTAKPIMVHLLGDNDCVSIEGMVGRGAIAAVVAGQDGHANTEISVIGTDVSGIDNALIGNSGAGNDGWSIIGNNWRGANTAGTKGVFIRGTGTDFRLIGNKVTNFPTALSVIEGATGVKDIGNKWSGTTAAVAGDGTATIISTASTYSGTISGVTQTDTSAPAASTTGKNFIKKITAANYTLNNTSWGEVDSTNLRQTLAASVGQIIVVGVNGQWGSEATGGCLDIATIVSGSPVNWFSQSGGATEQGAQGWRGNSGAATDIGGLLLYPVQAGDIVSGNVTVSLMFRTTSAVNKSLVASANTQFEMFGWVLG